ncbi:hypothetical protein M0R45_006829 [Rubus argutus]|uniref:Reverse transcriptase domain-containing protein n=1 Tax=Rubus argutus TaxID=59490 RepID=A0AAW1YSD6_RUBAR
MDGPEISPEVACHRLNTDPDFPPYRQRHRRFVPERNQIISDEVDRLLEVGFIQILLSVAENRSIGRCHIPIDAYSEYNQIPMAAEDQDKTAFITEKGLYCYTVMPFGLKNAGVTYQRLVNRMFKEQLGKTMEVTSTIW